MSHGKQFSQNLAVCVPIIIFAILLFSLISTGTLSLPQASTVAEIGIGIYCCTVSAAFLFIGGFWYVPPWSMKPKWVGPHESPFIYWSGIVTPVVVGAVLLAVGLARLFDPSIPGLFAFVAWMRGK